MSRFLRFDALIPVHVSQARRAGGESRNIASFLSLDSDRQDADLGRWLEETSRPQGGLAPCIYPGQGHHDSRISLGIDTPASSGQTR